MLSARIGMRLTNIKIVNHSRLADAQVEVREHLVLVGPNDVGKSSLLRCLDFLLGASTAQLYNRITIEDFTDSALPLVIEATLDGLDDTERAWFPDEATVDPATGHVSLTVVLSASVDPNGTLTIDRTAPGSGTGRQLSRGQVQALGWTLLAASATTRDLRDDRRTPLTDILARIELGDESAAFDSLVKQIQAGLDSSQVLDGLRGELANQLTRALPVAVAKEQLALVTGAAANGDVLADLRLHIERDGAVKDMTEQSDGLRALFALALYDLVSVGANIVAVDEPEVHLHPTSQRSLARLLKTGPNQKILATHSPDIVSTFSPESVVSVRAGGHLVQPKKDFLTDEQKLVVTWWVRDKLEPLTANRVLAVEGPSDRIFVEAIAEVTGRNLDRLGVSVVQTGGSASMPTIVKLFGPDGFDIPMTLLIDDDAKDTLAKDLSVAVADLGTRGAFVSTLDLEDEYIAALGPAETWQIVSTSGAFSKNQLNNCATNGPAGTPNQADVRAFVGHKKHKVLAAIAIAKALDPATAARIASVNDALVHVIS